jgi:hypothetical protein
MVDVGTATRHWRYPIRNARPEYEQTTTISCCRVQRLARRLRWQSCGRTQIGETDGRVGHIAIGRTERDTVLKE